jgi:hypothetical protein
MRSRKFGGIAKVMQVAANSSGENRGEAALALPAEPLFTVLNNSDSGLEREDLLAKYGRTNEKSSS